MAIIYIDNFDLILLHHFLSQLCVGVLFTSIMVPSMSLPEKSGVKVILSIANEIVISAQYNATWVTLLESSAETHNNPFYTTHWRL